ncbi:MAG: twin-arginine translocase subunit TatC [Actinomycetota bacterium]
MTEAQLAEGQMSLMDHLTELRNRIIRSVIAIAVGAVVAWFFYPQIFDFLIEPHCEINGDTALVAAPDLGEQCGLLAISPLEGFSVRLTVVGYAGIGIAMPFILWQVWQFIAPGLYPQEKRYGIVFVVLSFILFASGAALAYWSLPRALEFLANIGGDNLNNFYRPREYIGFVVKMMLGFGLGFEFPIVLIFLQLLGIVDNTMLRSGRRFAIVGIVALVAVLTPSGDPGTLMALSIPMYLFYEIAIAFGWWRARRQAKAVSAST